MRAADARVAGIPTTIPRTPPNHALGTITRGTTGVNRLRKCDRWMSHHPTIRAALHSTPQPLAIDLGYGAAPWTTVEMATRLRTHVTPRLEVVGLEIDPARIFPAQHGVRFEEGGFELSHYRPQLVRAFNVLRQYTEEEVGNAWRIMQSRLAPDGVIVEGTCNEVGQRAAWVLLDQERPLSLTLAWSPHAVTTPSEVAERLPKALIHRNVPGEKIYDLLQRLGSHRRLRNLRPPRPLAPRQGNAPHRRLACRPATPQTLRLPPHRSVGRRCSLIGVAPAECVPARGILRSRGIALKQWRGCPYTWNNERMTAPGTTQGQLPSRRRAAIPLIIIFLFTILLICLGIELYTRHSIGNQVADSISAEVNKNCTENPRDEQSCTTVGVPVRTSFGSTPILFGLSSKTLPQINVRIGPLPPADLRVGTVVEFDAKDIDYSDSNNLHFGSAHATLAIPSQALHNIITDEMKQQGGALAGALKVTKVTYHPDSSTIGLQLNNGLADLTIAPKVRDGQFVFELKDASVVGFRHQALLNGLRTIIPELSSTYLDLLPPGFTAESVTVHGESIDVELKGTNFTSQDLAQAGQTQRSSR